MNIFIKEESSLPIYEQIVSAVKNSILNHELAPGDMLPSIRSLAKSLGISVITTKRAYEELEKQGLIYSEQGKGFLSAGLIRISCSRNSLRLWRIIWRMSSWKRKRLIFPSRS